MLFPDTIGHLDESVVSPVRNTGYCLKEMLKTICSVAEDRLAKLNSTQVKALRNVLSIRYGFLTPC